jgi:hypothetical protein
MKREGMKQKGFIKAGNGIDFRKWIDDAKRQGYAVVLCGHYCELWA